MKLLMLPLLTGVCLLTVTGDYMPVTSTSSNIKVRSAPTSVMQKDESSSTRMPSIVFKAQDYCRAELEDFEFDIKFEVVSAKVMFMGANFATIETGNISSNSLEPIKKLMNKCIPGSIVIFDNVKVKGPDNLVRTIPGLTLSLY